MADDVIDLAVVLEMPELCRAYYTPPYHMHYWPDFRHDSRHLANPDVKRIRAVQTNGSFGLKRVQMEAMPALEIIAIVGAGFEGVDLAAARERGIVVTYGLGFNAPWVAEQAWALLLAAVHRVPAIDRSVRAGVWEELRRPKPAITGRKLGIFGMGHVGREVARRGEAFSMEIGYCNRAARSDVPYRHFDRLVDLAAWCDVLAITAPGGPETRHAVNSEVLTALGPGGYVVNVARGTVLDTAALVAALREGRIAGAGLDVIEGEPAVPPEVVAEERIVLSPHNAGFATDAMHAMMRGVRANLDAHFAGKAVPNPVP